MKYPTSFIDIDFETRSELDITVVGAYKYAAHPSTEILMISFSIDQVKIFNWNPFYPIRKNLRLLKEAIRTVVKNKAVFRAHNSEFEYWIYNLVGTRQFNWPALGIDRFYDTMVIGCVAGFPASLENATMAIGGNQEKDKGGKVLINFFSKPSRKKDEYFKDPLVYKDKFFEFIAYCDQDVRAQLEIVDACPKMTIRQWRIFQLTEQMNVRGLPIDKDMALGALECVKVYKKQADKEIVKLTKGVIESATQNIKLTEYIQELGCDIPNMKAPTIEKYLKKKLPRKIKRLLELRSAVSKSSTSKYKAALTYLSDSNKVHGFIKAFIAKTGRWGGRGLQIQNFSKPDKDFPLWADYDILAEAITEADIHFIELIYKDTMASLKAATRSMIRATKGKKFVCADYSQIEARIVMWVADDKTGLNDFAGEGKIYETMASEIFHIPVHKIKKPSFERDLGKEAFLGCGFGMGYKTFVFRCVEQKNLPVTEEIGKRAVKGYRKRYTEVQKAWKDCENAAINAIQNKYTVFTACKGKLAYKYDGDFLMVQLPSKRKLYYPHPKVVIEQGRWGEQEAIYYKTWVTQAKVGQQWRSEKIWGGTLFQHAVQAMAMDIMSNGMLNAESKGYPALFTVHDESLAMVDQDFGSVKEYEDILCQLEPWAKGLPIVAEGWAGTRYRK